MNPSRLLYAAAALLTVSAAIHTGVWLVDRSAWLGPVSWRKPIEFSVSFAITLATLGWILGRLSGPALLGWTVALSLSVASLFEVGLISLQRWRGVPSHFNSSTLFDATVFIVMGIFIGLVAFAIVVVTVWSFITRPRLESEMRLAVRIGLLTLVLGQAIGGVLLAQGFLLAEHRPVPSPVSSLVVAHAISLHGVQALPVAALAWRRILRFQEVTPIS